MTREEKRAWDRAYYQRNREKRIAQVRAYNNEYLSKGLRKPRKPSQPRRIRDHQRYLEKREEILAKQKAYREAHKAEIAERRRRRKIEKIYGKEL